MQLLRIKQFMHPQKNIMIQHPLTNNKSLSPNNKSIGPMTSLFSLQKKSTQHSKQSKDNHISQTTTTIIIYLGRGELRGTMTLQISHG